MPDAKQEIDVVINNFWQGIEGVRNRSRASFDTGGLTEEEYTAEQVEIDKVVGQLSEALEDLHEEIEED